MDKIYKNKHELWLKVLFSSFAVKNTSIKDKLYDFSQILFRHLKWISSRNKILNIEYNYDKSNIDIQKKSNFDFFNFLIDEITKVSSLYQKEELFDRIKNDENYIVFYLQNLLKDTSNDQPIEAFSKKRIYENKMLSKSSTDALTLFLFEETYKEYELIMVYSYMQNYTKSIKEYAIYQDLIDESLFHLKSFGNMLAKMGILSIPRVITESIYKVTNINKFINNGIKEEEAAKEECVKLASMVDDIELSKFFEFINFQENYHIELMKKLL